MPQQQSSGSDNNEPIRVMLVDDDPQRAELVESQLLACGYEVVTTIPSASGILHQISLHQPQIILMDIASPDRDMLESLALLNAHQPTPVVMFTQQDDPSYIRKAVDAGVSTYMVGNIDRERVLPVIEVALAQFRQWQTMRTELAEVRATAGERTLIERAKGLLMAHKSIDEDEAHRTLNRLAMNSNKTLAVVSETVIATLAVSAKGGKK